jgi:hypothetical protein
MIAEWQSEPGSPQPSLLVIVSTAMRSRIVTVLAGQAGVIAVLLAMGLGPVSSAARSSGGAASVTRPVALHLHWRRIANDTSEVIADDRYIAILPNAHYPDVAAGPTLLDTQTGKKSYPVPPGCSNSFGSDSFEQVVEFGGPFLAFTCGNSATQAHLLNLARGTWSTVAPAAALTRFCQPGCVLGPVGAHWIEYGTSGTYNEPCTEHCRVVFVEQSLYTGTVRSDPARLNGRSYAGLDSPSGVGALCSPLRTPPSYDSSLQRLEPGGLWLLGSFAVAQQFQQPDGNTVSYHLERCHSRLHLPLVHGTPETVYVAASDQAVVRMTVRIDSSRNLSGFFLPSLRGFTAQAPGAPSGDSDSLPVGDRRTSSGSMAVVGSTLIVRMGTLGSPGQVWEAKLPTGRH